MTAVRHVAKQFYAMSNEVLIGSAVDVAVTIDQISVISERVLGWKPTVVVLAEQARPVALADSAKQTIGFSRSAMMLSHVLHELAHLQVGADHGHDALFTAAFCDLVEIYGGTELADRLRAAVEGIDADPIAQIAEIEEL